MLIFGIARGLARSAATPGGGVVIIPGAEGVSLGGKPERHFRESG